MIARPEIALKDDKLKLRSRLLIGGIAGFVGTMAMTAAMRRLHRRLPEKERYPLTPREIVDSGSKQLGVPLPARPPRTSPPPPISPMARRWGR